MGLDIGKAHWSYGGFMRFRERVAREIGVCLWAMEGFAHYEGASVKFPKDYEPIPWSAVRDPLAWLLNHSDCEGTLSPEQCGAIAPRLREVATNWPEGDYDRQHAFILADEMQEAADTRLTLEFH